MLSPCCRALLPTEIPRVRGCAYNNPERQITYMRFFLLFFPYPQTSFFSSTRHYLQSLKFFNYNSFSLLALLPSTHFYRRAFCLSP